VLVPSPRWRDQLVFGLASFSSVSFFAIERANVDIVVYLVSISAAIALASNRGIRFAGYGLLLGAGLMKFYPLAALVLVVRERLWVCLVLIVTAFGVIIGFTRSYYDELTAALRNISSGLYFADHIGATILPVGIRHGAFQPIFSLLVGGDWGASSSKSLALGYVIAM